MNVDAFTLASLVDEFMDTLVGGRVQDVLDTDATGIGLEIYANHKRQYLYLSADMHTPRVHLVGDRLRRGLDKPTQLGLLLRRHVESGRVVHVSQPEWERILQIDIEGAEGEVSIIIEPMERRSNLLLVQNGVVLDCLRRVGADENRYRVSLPNHTYQLPPPMTGKVNPFTLDKAAFLAQWGANDDPKRKTAQWLSANLFGFSPLLAKETMYRATGNSNQLVSQTDASVLFDTLTHLTQPLKRRDWQHGVVEQDGQVLAFSAYPITHLQGWHSVASMSQAMTLFYGASVGVDAYNEAKKPVQEAIEEGRRKFGAKLASLESGLKDESERDLMQQSGELILAYQYTIQKGQTILKAQYDMDGAELTIKLDPTLTPLENAQRYFDRYNRAKRAQAGVPQLVEETQTELFFLAQLENDLRLASNYPEIDDVVSALQSRGLWQGGQRPKRGGSGRTGALRLTKDGYVIWVGRNSHQNEQVTFKHANPQDLWLHARGIPGAHGVIRNDGRRISDQLIAQVASVVAFYSASRGEKSVIVDVTRVKYVKKIKGAGMGMVTYRNEETVTVVPHNEENLK
jgi:predicted ribosome quality control (RQC) complex YloA/Tae2 family protein